MDQQQNVSHQHQKSESRYNNFNLSVGGSTSDVAGRGDTHAADNQQGGNHRGSEDGDFDGDDDDVLTDRSTEDESRTSLEGSGGGGTSKKVRPVCRSFWIKFNNLPNVTTHLHNYSLAMVTRRR
jgi:hypothetical protein